MNLDHFAREEDPRRDVGHPRRHRAFGTNCRTTASARSSSIRRQLFMLLGFVSLAACVLAGGEDATGVKITPTAQGAGPVPAKTQVPHVGPREVATPRLAALVTVYHPNSHAEMFLGRILHGLSINDKPPYPGLKLASLYTDQFGPRDLSRTESKASGFVLFPSPLAAVTQGGKDLAVDGVLLVAEHGDYPESKLGQTEYPKRRLFAAAAEACRKSGRGVPVFIDKHLADNWTDAKWIYDTARELKMPLMAGSSLPGTWRVPAVDVRRGAKVREILITSYHRLDIYGFHALEILQALAERRAGGETGIKEVICLDGEAVWTAGRNGVFDRALLDAALSRLHDRPIPPGKRVEDLAKQPNLMSITYLDGTKAHVLTLNGAVQEWTGAWKYVEDGKVESTLFRCDEERPYHHFSIYLKAIEKMMRTGQPQWPVERTLMTSGALDALLQSRKRNGKPVRTPSLNFAYQSTWNWTSPPALATFEK